jgi:hypothetical protein
LDLIRNQRVTTLTNYLTAFWSVVVINCAQPVNWQYCYRVDQWLIPGLQEGIELYFNPSTIYQSERDYLENINKDKKK